MPENILKGNTNEEKIWNFLIEKIQNPYGVAGVMGNMQAESNFKSNNLQQSYEKSLGFTDDSYTKAVDNNTYTNFIKDKAGYGLCQWTYWSLKRDLYNYMKKNSYSIGSLQGQLEFLCYQISNNYKAVWNTLLKATSVAQASNSFMLKFERPANQSVANQQKRATYGQAIYNKFYNKTETVEEETTTPIVEEKAIGTATALAKMNVRVAPNKNSQSLGTIAKGTVVDVLAQENKWYRIKYNNTIAYVSNSTGNYFKYTAISSTTETKIFTPYKAIVTADSLNVRMGPGKQYIATKIIKKGSLQTIIEEENNFGKLQSGGWVCLDYLRKQS